MMTSFHSSTAFRRGPLDITRVPPTFCPGARLAGRTRATRRALPRLFIGRLPGAGMYDQVGTTEAISVLSSRTIDRGSIGKRRATRVLFEAASEGLLVADGMFIEWVTGQLDNGVEADFGHIGRLDERGPIPKRFWVRNHQQSVEMIGSALLGSWGDHDSGTFVTIETRSWIELPYEWRHGAAAGEYSCRFDYKAEAHEVRWDRDALLAMSVVDIKRFWNRTEPRTAEYRYAKTAAAWQEASAALVAHVLVHGSLPGGGRPTDVVNFLREVEPGKFDAPAIDDARLHAYVRRIRELEAIVREQHESASLQAPID